MTSDGAVPVLCKVHDGNTVDSEVHQQNWSDLKALFGADFLYVADSKLCDADSMKYIAKNEGRFLTLMPRTWSEDERFRQWIRDNEVAWQEVYRSVNSRGKLWLYHVVDVIQALLEREVRKKMKEEKKRTMPLYREGMKNKAPTSEQVLRVFEGIRQVRLLDGQGCEIRRLHDPLPEVALSLLAMLNVNTAPYGLPLLPLSSS